MPGPIAITFNKIILKLRLPDFLLVTAFQNAPSPFNITSFAFLLASPLSIPQFCYIFSCWNNNCPWDTKSDSLLNSRQISSIVFFWSIKSIMLPRKDTMSLWNAFPSYKSILSFCHFPFNSTSLVNPPSKRLSESSYRSWTVVVNSCARHFSPALFNNTFLFHITPSLIAISCPVFIWSGGLCPKPIKLKNTPAP